LLISFSNETSIIALPLRHNVDDCVAELGLMFGRSNDDKIFNVLRSRNIKSLQRPTKNVGIVALLPSINCIKLAQPFINQFATTATTIVIDSDQHIAS
jgi:hypothetical protein